MLVAGIDVGSVAAKAVIFDPAEGRVAGRAVSPTGWNPKEAGAAVLDAALNLAGAGRGDLGRIVGTGYGRVSLPFAQKTVTEITCHAKGAAHLFPGAGVVLDIGGQDSKVTRLNADGSPADFVMNDKCAAGTGRFLQVVAGILNLSLPEFNEAAGLGRPAPISSMCAVFAETEIVGLLAKGTRPEDIAAGVFLSIARRMKGLARRIPFAGLCVFSGGTAVSGSFVAMLEEELGTSVRIPEYPQTLGALGAALCAAEQMKQFHCATAAGATAQKPATLERIDLHEV